MKLYSLTINIASAVYITENYIFLKIFAKHIKDFPIRLLSFWKTFRIFINRIMATQTITHTNLKSHTKTGLINYTCKPMHAIPSWPTIKLSILILRNKYSALFILCLFPKLDYKVTIKSKTFQWCQSMSIPRQIKSTYHRHQLIQFSFCSLFELIHV